jgi:sugar phosphate isomerase/epimerase
VDVPGALKAIKDIGFTGYGMLESSSPSGDVESDARRKLEYLQKLLGQ